MSAPLNKEEVGDNFYRKSKIHWKNEEGVLRVVGQVWSKNSPSSDTFAPSSPSILFDAPLLLFPAVFYC